MYVVGSPVHLTASFADQTGIPTDVSSVVLNLIDPTGTVLAPLAASHVSTGIYAYDYTATLTGNYTWWFSGAGGVTSKWTDVFTVSSPTTGALVSLADAKAQLNKTATTDDDEIFGYIHTATAIVNRMCGYTAPTTVTETLIGRVDGSGMSTLALGKLPVLSVGAITSTLQGYPAIDPTAVLFDPDTGVVYLSNYQWFYGPMTVTYVAGRTSVPNSLRTACLLIVQWLWETQRGGGSMVPGMGGDDTSLTEDGTMIPARAYEIMRQSPYVAAPGIA